MQISQFIVVRKNNWRYSSRMTQKVPSLASNEIAVKVVLEIPDAIFTRPALSAQITIPNDAISKPVINAEVIDNVQDIIQQNTGFDVRLEVINATE